ncbi:MAG: hypothetical protein L0Y64_01710 [Myxococcaceae bacterium]|nr:hypothetical protein [Myxococcaceae bacterium]
MSKKEKPQDFGFVAPAEVAKQRDPLDVLLEGTEGAVQPDDATLGALEEEFRVLANLRKRVDGLEGQLEEAKSHYNAQVERMQRAMQAQGTRQFKSGAGHGSCYLQEHFQTKVVDDTAFMEWVQGTHPELLTVNSQTRTSFIRKEYRDRGVAPDSDTFPPGIAVEVHERLTVRGVKGKE